MDKAPLSQEEIDALLAAAAADDVPPEPALTPAAEASPRVVAQPVEFERMNAEAASDQEAFGSVSLILDVPMNITVELGRARMVIKEILSMSPGSVVELDKQAGEPVDILVNGKLLARGEVVVIDENFGVRISEIVSKTERLTGLK